MIRRVTLQRKLKLLWSEGEAKASAKCATIVLRGRPESGRSIHGQAEVAVIGHGGPNPLELKIYGMIRG